MGIGKSNGLKVSFDRSSAFYYAGEQITGIISFHNKQKKLTLNKVFLEFIGEVGYTTQETLQNHANTLHLQTEHHSEYYRIPFINIQCPILQPNENESEITLRHGQYSWPFEFVIPQYLPPSLPSYPYVNYYTRVVFDKPWYKTNVKQVFPLTIFPLVNSFQLNDGEQSVALFRPCREQIKLKVHLHQKGIVPGQNISLGIDLENPKQLKIQRIEAQLIQHRQIAQIHHIDVIFQRDLSDLKDFNGTELHKTFDLLLPFSHLAPTYKNMLQLCDSSLRIDIHYELKLEVKINQVLTGLEMSIPIIVGTETLPERYQSQRNDDSDMPISYMVALEETELPPNYESVMKNFQIGQISAA